MRFKLDQLLDSLEFTEKQIFKTTKEIRRFCQTDPELSQCIEYMMTVSGVGWIVASQLLARIGDWRELENTANWEDFWVWSPWSTPPEINRSGTDHPYRRWAASK